MGSGSIIDEHRTPLSGDDMQYYGQYVALVVAETLESATEGAALVRVTYAPGEIQTRRSAMTKASVNVAATVAIPMPPSLRLDHARPDLSHAGRDTQSDRAACIGSRVGQADGHAL